MGDGNSPAGRPPPTDASMQQTLLGSIPRFVSSMDHAILDAPVTVADLAAEIRHMRTTSAPGMVGLTAGFYRVASEFFGEFLSIVLLTVFAEITTSISAQVSSSADSQERFAC